MTSSSIPGLSVSWELLDSWEEGHSFFSGTFLQGKSGVFHTSTGQDMARSLKQPIVITSFSPVTADQPFTNIPTDMIAADTNNAVHISSANANNALGIITVNTNNYC